MRPPCVDDACARGAAMAGLEVVDAVLEKRWAVESGDGENRKLPVLLAEGVESRLGGAAGTDGEGV